jgi:hypothetical protein
MSNQISLKEAERKAFKASYNDGLWDIFLGCFVLIFALAPILSERLGDFWSSVLFLPVWGLVYLIIWLVRRNVLVSRIGIVKIGAARKARLKRFNNVMVGVNVLVLVLGIVCAFYFKVFGQTISILFGSILLILFSIAAYYLDFNRLYAYGLLVGLAPLIGEWLYNRGDVPHHGYPITFGIASGIMILVGLYVLVRLLSENPMPMETVPSNESHDG